jgi:murein DD-endopeptidase MepM/ murein hydrolase activator NlpD
MMPPWSVVLDLSRPLSEVPDPGTLWTIGRYGENRGIYTQALFAGRRTVHLGLDLGGPVGTAVHAPVEGVVCYGGYNAQDGDYGNVLVVEHAWKGAPLWALYGHLSAASLAQSPVGRRVARGAVLGWLGDVQDNGGWPPHVHLQLSTEDPGTHDMPGAVAVGELAAARQRHPDPAAVFGPGLAGPSWAVGW